MATSNTAPASQFVSITPNDGADIPVLQGGCRAIWVGGAGTVVVRDQRGVNVPFVGVPTGYMLPIETKRILATGTTATNIVALY